MSSDDRPRQLRSADNVLSRLKQGPATNADLSTISLKYTSRISDLRGEGHTIRAKRLTDSIWEYTLLDRDATPRGQGR